MAKHISQVRSEPFERAIRASLSRLVESKKPFSIQDVISDARYDDGRQVGSTTIYGKYSGRRKHAALLEELRAAAERSHASTSADVAASPTAGASPDLLKQVLTLGDRILELELDRSSTSHVVSRLREELFVALCALNHACAGTVLEIRRKTEELREQIASPDLRTALEEEAKAWAREVQLAGAFVR